MTAASPLDAGIVLGLGVPPDGGMSPLVQLIPFALILGIFYVVILLPMRRRQKKVQAFLDGLKVGDKVVTSGGMYGVVTKLGERALQLQIADRVRVEVSRAAIVGYQGQEPVVSESTSP
jgi:preprotein translocase subunit YajC